MNSNNNTAPAAMAAHTFTLTRGELAQAIANAKPAGFFDSYGDTTPERDGSVHLGSLCTWLEVFHPESGAVLFTAVCDDRAVYSPAHAYQKDWVFLSDLDDMYGVVWIRPEPGTRLLVIDSDTDEIEAAQDAGILPAAASLLDLIAQHGPDITQHPTLQEAVNDSAREYFAKVGRA